MRHEIDFRSDTWKALEDKFSGRLNDLRRKNDGQLSAEQTAYLRGRIAEIKDLLTLATPAPALMADE